MICKLKPQAFNTQNNEANKQMRLICCTQTPLPHLSVFIQDGAVELEGVWESLGPGALGVSLYSG